jgi:hypothetical protein
MSGKQARRERQLRQVPAGRNRQGSNSEEARYQTRVSQILGGQLAQQSAAGVRALFRCNVCGRVWLQDPVVSQGSHVVLSESDRDTLAIELGANLAVLPYATCRICTALHGIGELAIDEYGHGQGYGLSWEGTDPPGAHILATFLSTPWISKLGGTPPVPGVVTQPSRMRALFAWLEHLPAPSSYSPVSTSEARQLAGSNPPGYGAPGTEGWVWHGGAWRAECPALDGPAIIQLYQAMPPSEPYNFAATLITLHVLALHLQGGRIAGEEFAPGEQY